MLAPGDRAVDFSLAASNGETLSLRSLRGQRVVLYFYPKDNTPGCTTEACDFRDNMARVSAVGAVVLGISKDSIASHQRFQRKYELPFLLLSDPDNAVATAYGAYGEKTLYGRTTMGTIRSTFLIDETGRVEQVWRKVKVKGHVDQVLEAMGQAPVGKKKTAAKKSAAKKTAAKKTAAKKTAAKKTAAKKTAAKKTAAKKTAAKKSAAKKTAAKKAAAKKSAAKKTAAKKTAAKKTAAKRKR